MNYIIFSIALFFATVKGGNKPPPSPPKINSTAGSTPPAPATKIVNTKISNQ